MLGTRGEILATADIPERQLPGKVITELLGDFLLELSPTPWTVSRSFAPVCV